MNFNDLLNRTVKVLRDNSPAILTALGVSGTISTAYLAAKASFKAARIIDSEQRLTSEPLTLKEKTELVWELYVPVVLSGTATVACVIGATTIGNRRTAAVTAAYSLTERAFGEYRDKVVEQIGEGKERKVRDDLAQARVEASPPKDMIIASGKVICHEALTGRYFECDMETLRKAENQVNAKLLKSTYLYLSDFYDLIGLEYTAMSNHVGWEADRLLELQFTSVLTPQGRPCLSFVYNYTKPI